MSNRYYDAQSSKEKHYFTDCELNGLNIKGNSHTRIKISGNLDHFTKKTLYENYDRIAQNLNVYPTVEVYPRNAVLPGGVSGFYDASQNHILLIDHYYLISVISHEMRHAYQYIYFPDLFFNTSYNSARSYLDCEVERDARGYAIDYCEAQGYLEELQHLEDDERKIELIIQKQLSPEERGMDDDYFRRNPVAAEVVPRTYHRDYEQGTSRYSLDKASEDRKDFVIGCLFFISIAIAAIYFLFK